MLAGAVPVHMSCLTSPGVLFRHYV
jgi:hypothetical protein